jgi:hypothetical protein
MRLKSTIILKLVFLLLILQTAFLAIEGKPRKMQNIPTGTWGGQHIKIDVQNGSATVEYDCAIGTIAGPLKLDSKGKFSLSGTHATEGGPTRIDGPGKGQPARFTGWTDGKKMTLTVTLGDSKEPIGTFELEHGNPGRLRKCR